MKFYEVRNNKVTALSALKRKSSAPQLVVVAPSGSGKSTLIYLLLNHRLIPYMKIGIGEKSQTTIIPCEFCFDERIMDDETFAIQIVKKDYASKDIHMSVLTVLMDLFGRNDCDTDETIDAFDEKGLEHILEPEEAHYHLGQIRDDISFKELLDALTSILEYIVDNDFKAKVKQRKDELKSKKVKLPEVREMIFEEMFEAMPENIKAAYVEWLNKIGDRINAMLAAEVGEEMLEEKMLQYGLEDGNNGTHVLEVLFDPFAPYSLVIDHISIACRPRQELIDIAQKKSPELPFRFCIRDTMGLTQKGIDAASTKDALEAALNCKADTILFLLSLDERDDILSECCKALVEKKDELMKKSHLDISVYVLFTKADRKVENLINKRNMGDLYIDENTYSENIQSVLADLELRVRSYANILPQEEVGWLSMRYLKDSYVLKALEGDERKRNFEPEGLFEKIVDYSMKTLRGTLPAGVKDPLFVTAIEPDKPAIQVVVDPEKIKTEIESMQHNLCEETDIVNGYVISDKTPKLHGRSVYSYWNNLIIGLGHTTKASVYGNFSINMKGLLKRMFNNVFTSFAKFDENSAVKFTAENLDDEVLMDVLKTLLRNEDIEVGLNPALGEKYMALQRLYEFYIEYFMNESRFASLIDRVAYDLSYGNPELKQYLTSIYNNTPGYDGAMRKLQLSFKAFFGSNDFTRILVSELNQIMTEMVNRTFIII
jgi:hypothetical protein